MRGYREYLTGPGDVFLGFSRICLIFNLFYKTGATPIIEGQEVQAGKQGGS
jgi:hypothetical protein